MSNYEILNKKMREILGYLYQKGPATPNEISIDIEMSYMAVKRWINILKELGIIKIYEIPFLKSIDIKNDKKINLKKTDIIISNINKNNKKIIARGPTEWYTLDLEKIYGNHPK